MKKPKVDLAGHLKKTRQQNILKFILWPSIGLFVIGLLYYGLTNLPWHWQLFMRWLVRGGDVSHIPEKFYKELSDLCYTSDRHGKVDGYKGSLEIAYTLGNFHCERTPDGEYWIIQDIYTFARPEEAGAGTPIAVLLVSIFGTDYSYKIETIIPVIKD